MFFHSVSEAERALIVESTNYQAPAMFHKGRFAQTTQALVQATNANSDEN